MKRISILFAAAALTFAACSSEDEVVVEPSLVPGSEPLEFTAHSASATFTFTTNVAWSVTNENDWLTVSPASGEGSSSVIALTVEVAENTELESRSGFFTIATETLSSQHFVSQEGATDLLVGEDRYSIARLADGRVWMVEPLHYIPDGKKVSSDPSDENGLWYPYEVVDGEAVILDNADSIARYGYLYDLATALGVDGITDENYAGLSGVQGICPDGWHIPTRNEYLALVGNSNKAADESSALIDDTAAYYDKDYNGGKVTTLNKDGFNWTMSGYVNRTASTSTGKYSVSPVLSSSTSSVTEWYGRPSTTIIIGSTPYQLNSAGTNYQFFGLMITFTSTYPDGRLNVAYANYLAGYPARCIKDEE